MALAYCEDCYGETWHDDISRSSNNKYIELFKCGTCGRVKRYDFS